MTISFCKPFLVSRLYHPAFYNIFSVASSYFHREDFLTLCELSPPLIAALLLLIPQTFWFKSLQKMLFLPMRTAYPRPFDRSFPLITIYSIRKPRDFVTARKKALWARLGVPSFPPPPPLYPLSSFYLVKVAGPPLLSLPFFTSKITSALSGWFFFPPRSPCLT